MTYLMGMPRDPRERELSRRCKCDHMVAAVDPCRRDLCDECCEERCCIACHAEERLGDDELGAACLTEWAEDLREDHRVGLNRCTTGCGWCGMCGRE